MTNERFPKLAVQLVLDRLHNRFGFLVEEFGFTGPVFALDQEGCDIEYSKTMVAIELWPSSESVPHITLRRNDQSTSMRTAAHRVPLENVALAMQRADLVKQFPRSPGLTEGILDNYLSLQLRILRECCQEFLAGSQTFFDHL